MNRALLLLFLAIGSTLVSACEDIESVVFSEPQPRKVKADKEIRSDYRGLFFHDEDSLWLFVTERKAILSNSPYIDDKAEKKSEHIQIGNESDIEFDIQVEKDSGERKELDIKGQFRLTLLDMDKGGLPKFFKGYYFLNHPAHESAGYHVRILRPSSTGLLLCRIKSDSLPRLLEGKHFVSKKTDPDGDQTSWLLSPSRQELKKLIASGLFAEVLDFKRVLPPGQTDKATQPQKLP